MAIEIRIESSWGIDDGDGRSVEVTISTRAHPGEDPAEDSRWFAGGDMERLKAHICELVDRKADFFVRPDARECTKCRRVVTATSRAKEYRCKSCQSG